MLIKKNSCNGCDDCISCGRGEYEIHACDKCRTADETLWNIDDVELCYECLEDYIMVENYRHEVFGENFKAIKDQLNVVEMKRHD